MNISRFLVTMLFGSLIMATAFASGSKGQMHSSFLTTDQIATIQKECSDQNDGSTTSKAYQDCVKEKEDAIMAKTSHHHHHSSQ